MEWLAIVRRPSGGLFVEPMGVSPLATEICRRWYAQHDTSRVSLVAVVRRRELQEIIEVLSKALAS